MNRQFETNRNAAFEHRLAMLAAGFTGTYPPTRPGRAELRRADRAFQLDNGFTLVTRLRRIRDLVALWLQRRAAIAELHALSDATLADIGVPRHMIAGLVNQRFKRQSADAQTAGVNVTRQRTWCAPAALGEAGNALQFDNAA